jgi:phosphomannomutase
VYTTIHMTYELAKNYERSFKDADIRGVYPVEINEGVAYAVARAFVEEFKYTALVVGSDMRLSTPALHAAFIEGARDAGATVTDVGLVATPQLYFASGSLRLPGVMITASHSPKEYNGLKLIHAEAIPLTKRNGLAQILKRVKKGKWEVVKKRGGLKTKNIDAGYVKMVTKGMKPARYEGIHLATDIGNGMAHEVIPLLRERLPIHFDTLFARMDGSFPNRDSDPNLHENQVALDAKIDHGHYDFGISFDGDADRIAFLDEHGNYVNSAAIGALITTRILAREPKATIASTNLNSRIYEETIKKHGGRVVMARTGHTFVKEQMRKHGAAFGCEYSGHFFFRDFFYTDSVVLTLREVLDAYLDAKKAGQTFGEMMAPYLVYEQTEDVVVKVVDKEVAMAKIHDYLMSLKPVSIKTFDGYFVDFGDVWGAVKMSVTEYAVKLMFESRSKAKAKKLQSQILKYVKSIAKDTVY